MISNSNENIRDINENDRGTKIIFGEVFTPEVTTQAAKNHCTERKGIEIRYGNERKAKKAG